MIEQPLMEETVVTQTIRYETKYGLVFDSEAAANANELKEDIIELFIDAFNIDRAIASVIVDYLSSDNTDISKKLKEYMYWSRILEQKEFFDNLDVDN